MNAVSPSSILLYRYLDAAAALKSIEHCRLRISRIFGLNDPFEFLFGAENYAPNDTQKVVGWLHKDLVRAWSQKIGFISYSKKWNDPVLWGHYADKHKGVVFEVKRPANLPRKVKYTSKRPAICIQRYQSLRGDNAKLHQYLKPLLDELFEHKALSWKYEKEYRDIFDLTKSELFELQDGFYHIRIEDGLLKKVILGCRCDFDETYIERVLKKAGLGSVKVVRARLSPDKYEIEV